jgi:hypothetical protein
MRNHKGFAAPVLLMVALILVLQSFSLHAQAPAELKQIGEIALTKGVVTARSEQRALTALAKGSPVFLGDIIETASRSFTVIKFSDGGKVTLRPESRFDLNEYDDTAGQEKESFELIKGGLRAVTGAIGKARPEQVTYTARNTTIGIRGTTFVVKLCEEGVDGCRFISGDTEESIGDPNRFVDIFVVDQDGSKRQRITRQQLKDLLVGIYVSVIEGSIRVNTDEWFIDMTAGDKCAVDFSESSEGSLESQDEVECFTNSKGIEDIDVYLGPDAEKITVFNLFDDSEIFVGNEICEIN